MGNKIESGRKKYKERERLPRGVVAVGIFRSFVAVDCGDSGRGVMLDGGDGRYIFREQHRFVPWVEVLGGQGWASPGVWDDRGLEITMSDFLSGWRFRVE